MRRGQIGILTILALSPPLWAFGQTPDGPQSGRAASPKERLAVIVKAQQDASQQYGKAFEGEKSAQERQKAIDRYVAEVRKNTKDALDLVRAHPHDPVDVEALHFVIRYARAGPSDASEQAMRILARDHIRDPKMGELCDQISGFFHLPIAESLIRAVLEQHPNHEDRGLACHGLAAYLKYQAKMVRRLREKPEQVEDYVRTRGKEAMARFLRETVPDELDKEAEALLERVASEFGTVAYNQKTLADLAAGELFALRHLQVGKVAPEIEGKDIDGKAFKLSDFRGKVVVLTFSGNWCGPCVGMYPQERELVVKLTGKPFALVSVSTDANVETLKKSIDSGEITWRCWWDGGTDGPITTRWGVSSFPTIYVLDPGGVIRFKDARGEALDEAVSALLSETSATRPKP